MVSTRSSKSTLSAGLEDARNPVVKAADHAQPSHIQRQISKPSAHRSGRRGLKPSPTPQKTISGRITKYTRSKSLHTLTKTKIVVLKIKKLIKKRIRRSSRSLKVKLSGVQYARLDETIRQLDYKVLRQQKRLENYKGRYYPPALNQCKNRYQFKFGHNPLQHVDFKAPTVDSQWKVYELMKKDLKENFNKECFLDQPDATTNELQDGPMHMTDDLSIDNLVKVILSIATENSLAIRQHAQLCSIFTYTVNGKELKGTIPNYHKMRLCSPEGLVEALNIAGQYNLRQKAFHSILHEVYSQNVQRLSPDEVVQEGNLFNAPDFVPGLLSMEYLRGDGLSKQDRFDLLVKFDQIAVKTGCCLLAFNLKIPVFVVDTHVHNMVRILKWIPEDCLDADKACMYLDKIMPDELKFGLHQAFWHHRINCVRCMPRANPMSLAYQQRSCPLEEWVNRKLPSLRRIMADKEKNKDGASPKPTKKANENDTKQDKEKKRPSTMTFLKMHSKAAEQAGYVLRKNVIDDDFGEGSRQNKEQEAKYYWGLKEYAHANDIVSLEEALEEVTMTVEEYEAKFVKKVRAKGTKRKTKSKAVIKEVEQDGDGDANMVEAEEESDEILAEDDDSDDSDYNDAA